MWGLYVKRVRSRRYFIRYMDRINFTCTSAIIDVPWVVLILPIFLVYIYVQVQCIHCSDHDHRV